jgi:hypothetical protein
MGAMPVLAILTRLLPKRARDEEGMTLVEEGDGIFAESRA